MELLLTIDRIEEGTAVLLVRPDEERAILWPLVDLPPECNEGDILKVAIEISQSETKAARDRVQSLLRRLLDKAQEDRPDQDRPPEA